MSDTGGEVARCAWCSARVAPGAVTCPACGAAVAQRESIGDLVIPGVTAVHPALEAYDAQPLRIPGQSPTQSLAAGAITALAAGGITGIAGIGGVAAMAAVEYLGARRPDGSPPVDLDRLGEPSEAATRMVEEMERRAGPAGSTSAAPASGEARPPIDPDTRPGPGEPPDRR